MAAKVAMGAIHNLTGFRWQRIAAVRPGFPCFKMPRYQAGSFLAQLTGAAAWQRYVAVNR